MGGLRQRQWHDGTSLRLTQWWSQTAPPGVWPCFRTGWNSTAAVSAQQPRKKDARLWYEGLDHDPEHQVDWRMAAPGVPWVTDVDISSDPGDDDTYILGDTISVKVTFSEAVTVDTTNGTPRLEIDFSSGDDDEKWAGYASGASTSTTELIFQYTVAADRSPLGVAAPERRLDLNGRARYAPRLRKSARTCGTQGWTTTGSTRWMASRLHYRARP